VEEEEEEEIEEEEEEEVVEENLGEDEKQSKKEEGLSEKEKKETSAYPSPPPSESCDEATPKATPTAKSAKLTASKPVSVQSVISATSNPSKDTFYKGTDTKGPTTPILHSIPSWQGVYQYLVDSITALPTNSLQKSLEDYTKSGELDEISLSIWTLQSHKRFLRSLDPIFSSNPKRLFIPPNAAQAIESALINGYRDTACDMLKKLWLKLSPIGPPEHIVMLVNKEGHWVIHW